MDLSKKNAELKDGDVIQLMKNKYGVKNRLSTEAQAKESLLNELGQLNSIADKLLKNKSLEKEEFDMLQCFIVNTEEIDESLPYKVKNKVQDLTNMISNSNGNITDAAKKFHQDKLEELKGNKIFVSKLFDLNAKIKNENLPEKESTSKTQRLLNKYLYMKTEGSLEAYSELVRKPEKELAAAYNPNAESKKDIMNLIDSRIKAFNENKDFVNKFAKEEKGRFDEIKARVSKKAKDFKPVKEEAEKALKRSKLIKGIAIGAAIGTAVGAVIAFAIPKKKTKKSE